MGRPRRSAQGAGQKGHHAHRHRAVGTHRHMFRQKQVFKIAVNVARVIPEAEGPERLQAGHIGGQTGTKPKSDQLFL